MKFSRDAGGGYANWNDSFLGALATIAVIFSATAAMAATTISTDITTGGNLSVTGTSVHTGLATFGNASSTIFSAAGPAYFGATGASAFSAGGILSLISALTVPNGGTGASTFGQGWIFSSGGTGALSASTSPTVNYITATSTTIASQFPYLSISAGTASSPALFFTSDIDTGIFRASEDVIAFASAGSKIATLEHVFVNGTQSNTRFIQGTRPVVNSVGGSEHYLATINPGSVTQQGDSPVVGFNLADFIITALDQSTRTYGNWGIEHDKLVLRQTGGAVTFNKAGSTRFRFPFAETGVTLVDSIGLSFFLPNAEDVTGTVTNYKAIHFPALTGGGGTNFYGLYFENAPNGGSIASKPGTDITIVAGSGGSTNSNIIASSTNFTVNTSLAGETGTVILNGGGASGVVQIKTNGLEIMRFGTVGASQNYLRVDANNTPLLMSQGPGAGVGLNLSSKGTSAIQFFTNGWNQEQFRVTHTASAVNYMTATGGAVGTGVTLSANGSDTDINLLLAPKGAGSVGIGVTSPTSLLQVATSTNNATTSVEIGKTGQNKGSCLVLYDATGAVQYVTIQGGAFVISPTSCK